MKQKRIHFVSVDNRKKLLMIRLKTEELYLPFVKLAPAPTAANKIKEVFVDPELGSHGVTYRLDSGDVGSVHLDAFLEYNGDPKYMIDLLKYELTLIAHEKLKETKLSKNEIIRRLSTSPSQLKRILDTTNFNKSIDQLLRLLSILGCEISLEAAIKTKKIKLAA